MRIESKERYSRYLQTPKEGVDPLKELCDKLRSKGGVDWRQAILADQRVEFLRGKDLAAYFRSQPEQMLKWVNRGASLEDQVRVIAELMMRRGLLIKADRKFKSPKPGMKRRAKWPKKLVPLRDQAFQEEFFYAWQYDRPSSPWLFLSSCLLVVVVILFCLFPLAPQPMKLAVVYLSMTLLILISIVIAVRTLIAAVSWIALGRALWLFPYLLSEDKGLDEAFWPIFQLDEEGKDKNKLLQGGLRVGTAASLIGLSYAFYHHVPDKGAAIGGAKHAHDAILDMLNLHGGKLSLTDEPSNGSQTAQQSYR